METVVQFTPDVAIDTDDFNNLQADVRQSFDDIVFDAIEPGSKYAAFIVSQTGPTSVTVAPGRFYSGGQVFPSVQATVLPLISNLPVVTQKFATIVVWGNPDVQGPVVTREQIINTDTGQFQPVNVSISSMRQAQINVVYGPESAAPQRGIISSAVTPICDVLLSPSGVVSITMDPTNALGSVDDAEEKLTALSAWQASIGSQINTLRSDLAVLRGLIPPNLAAILQGMAQAIADLQALFKRPATCFFSALERFLNTNNSSPSSAGYSALVSDGLRFPYSTRALTQLQLLNPLEPLVQTQGNVTLPVFNTVARLSVMPIGSTPSVRTGAFVGELDLGPFSQNINIISYVFLVFSYHVLRLRRLCLRYGSNIYTPVSDASRTGLVQYNIGSVAVVNTGSAAGVAEAKRLPALDFFTASRVGGDVPSPNWTNFWTIDNPSRLVSQRRNWCWTDYYDDPYWSPYSASDQFNGGVVSFEFIATNSGWITDIKLFFASLGTSGDIYYRLCLTDKAGRPDQSRAIGGGALPFADLTVGKQGTLCGLTASFVTAGERYAFIIQTAGNHQLAAMGPADAKLLGYPAVSSYYNDGTSTGSSAWRQIVGGQVPFFQIFMAQFTNNVSEVQLQPGSLVGGIAQMRIMAEAYAPPGTNLSFRAQIAGAWIPINPDNVNIFATLPNLVPLMAVYSGTAEVQPGINFGQSELDVGVMATSLNYWEAAITLPQNTTSIHLDAYLSQWDGAFHTFTGKVWVSGTSYTPTVTDTPDSTDPTKLKRSMAFTVPSTGTFQWEVLSTTSGNGFPLCTEVWASAF
jgi:hypothetical protein